MRCAYCDALAVLNHHLTAALYPGEPYLDPCLTGRPCRACHHYIHKVLWPAAGLDMIAHPARARLLRLAMHFDLAAQRERAVTFAPDQSRAVVVLLRECADAIPEGEGGG